MMLSNQQQLAMLFHGLGFGVWLGVCYDLLTVWRNGKAHRKGLLFVADIVFSLAAGTGLFLFALPITGGEIRPLFLFAVGGGTVVGRATLGRLLSTALPAIGRAVRAADRVFRQQLGCFARFLQKTSKKAVLFSKKGLHCVFYMLYNKNRH